NGGTYSLLTMISEFPHHPNLQVWLVSVAGDGRGIVEGAGPIGEAAGTQCPMAGGCVHNSWAQRMVFRGHALSRLTKTRGYFVDEVDEKFTETCLVNDLKLVRLLVTSQR